MSQPPIRPDVAGIIGEITRSGDRLAGTLAALTDADMRAPSSLPGWTRGHVIAHLSRSADAYRWLLAVARTGAEPSPRTGAEAFARAVEDGAALPAAELVTDARTCFARLAEDAASMPAEAWDTLVTALAGWRHPAWYTLCRCWRELETHHVDLGTGYRTADWPVAYVTWALDDTLAALTARGFPVAHVEAVDLGRSWTVSPAGPAIGGPGHALLGWLSGRAADDPLMSDRPLPTPPNWPMPPAPGWG
ncbi:maleylpyruvate isomerase family mycothiol-dependent enzyme [Streptosporangium sp. NPDC000396]|uniref:maleylpyruvate isomerase family mycothiol-dependent enzyme n=1 Tax=Streptosporangium sp. NPDC000396 TaxID=3366185 RepID=UPI003676414A